MSDVSSIAGPVAAAASVKSSVHIASVPAATKHTAVSEHSLDVKICTAVLQCLAALGASQQCRRYMTPLAQDIAGTATLALCETAPLSLQSAGLQLFRALIALDSDGLAVILLTQIPPLPACSDTVQSQLQLLYPDLNIAGLQDTLPLGLGPPRVDVSPTIQNRFRSQSSALDLLRALERLPEQF